MGSRSEEQALAKHMPESFKKACPHCKTPWTFNTVLMKVQIVCNVCDRDQVIQSKPSTWWANSGSYVAQYDWAWQKLWRAFVQSVGLNKAITMSSH